MFDSVMTLFSSNGFMPHGMCYLWQPDVLALHVASDALITLSYFSIPFTLLYFVRKRHDLEFNWVFVCFAVFIVACGATHAMEIWVIWHPTYWLSGTVKAITALASVPTAILLIKLIPDALQIPSPGSLQQVNVTLANEIAERKRAEADVRRLNEQLELHVQERTQQLEAANLSLRQEVTVRNRVEQELRESESRLRAVLDSALSAVIVMNAEGLIIDWNSRAETLFSWTRAEAVGRMLSETIIPVRYRDAHARGLKHFLDTGNGQVFNQLMEMTALRRDSTEFPIELSISPLINGSVRTFCGFITDITERMRAQQAVRSSQALLQAIIDNSMAVVYVKDLEGRYLLVNSRYAELLGLDRDWFVGKTDHDVFPNDPVSVNEFRANDLKVLASSTALELEEIVPHDGVLHTYVSIKCRLTDASGNVYALCGISTDITERKQSERKQLQQLNQLRLLNRITRAISERQDLNSILPVVLDNLEENFAVNFSSVLLHDPATAALTVAMVGTQSHARAATMLLNEHSHIPIDENGLARCVTGQLVYEPDIKAVPFSFPQRLFNGGLNSLVIVPLMAKGTVFGVLVAARTDISGFSSSDCEFLRQLCEHVGLAWHQAQLHGELQNAYEDLRQSQQTILQQERLRALGQMASGVAHDINNAISPAALYTESLLEQEPGLSDLARGYLSTIHRAIQDVAQTVSRMREFSRPREAQMTFAPINLNRLVEQVVELTRVRWSNTPQEKGIVITLSTELAIDIPLITGIEGEIRDALINLIFNAVDAMPEGGVLTLRTLSKATSPTTTQPKRGEVWLEVSDTGIGMDDDIRSHCLEPFFTTKGERGTGLGLAMVYGMVQRHGIDLSIDSKQETGTTMRLVFPVSIATTAPVNSSLPLPSPTLTLNILLVDDDAMILEMMTSILQRDGHQVIAANGGQAGIDAFVEAIKHNQRIDVVITDLGMPYVDGRRVAAAVKAASPATPIILFTGWGQQLTADNEMPDHVDRVLSKPPSLEDLRQSLIELTTKPAGRLR